MSDAVTSSLGVVAYLALFATVGILFLLVNLIVGKLVRVDNPHEEKLEIYECGEPAVGSSFVQFDIRFYVVALLFIIFDVEVAFFFPWATVFGKANHLADLADRGQVVAVVESDIQLTSPPKRSIENWVSNGRPCRWPYRRVSNGRSSDSTEPAERSTQIVRFGAQQLALITILDIGVFFAILLVGFAYVWQRGDLNWVRAYRSSSERGGVGRSSRDGVRC